MVNAYTHSIYIHTLTNKHTYIFCMYVRVCVDRAFTPRWDYIYMKDSWGAGIGGRKPVRTGGDGQLSLGQNLWYVRPSCPGIPARGPYAAAAVVCVQRGARVRPRRRRPKTSVM